MNVTSKANALAAAWVRVTGAPPPSKNAVLLALAQADLETADGDAWGGVDGPHDWGATDYRAPNVAELAAIQAGSLKNGMWLYPDGTHGASHRPDAVAQLHTDSHPGGGSYSMWFAAFPDDTAGAGYYLKIVMRMAAPVLANPASTTLDWALAVYQHNYFEGVHAGARPVGQRNPPLNQAETLNVRDYAAGMDRCLAMLRPALATWDGAPDDQQAEALAKAALLQAANDLPDDPPTPPEDLPPAAS